MNKHQLRLPALLSAAIVAGLCLIPSVASAYTGTMSVGAGLLGSGNWFVNGPTSITWNVNQNTDNSWNYSYDFSHPVSATSHFIIEVSDSFTRNDIFGEWGDFSCIEIGDHAVQSGNPNMPETIYGIKFDESNLENSHFEFNSFRVPVWGDFFAKGGNAGGHGVNTAWNAGFTLNDFDPIAPPADHPYMNHLLVPDTQSAPQIPEPTTLALLGLCACGYLVIRRRLG